MQKARKTPLIKPRAAISQENKPENSWYSIQAAVRGVAEIMLYDDIGAWGISARQFARDLAALGDVPQINLRIHSGGGDVMDGTAMYNCLRGHSARVEVYIDGMAASMASVVAMAGDVIYMPANATMMVHKPWCGQVGDADDMRETADLLDKLESTLIQAYVRKTGKSVEEVAAMLKKTTWMDGNEAVAAGFADQVLEPLKAAAQLSSKRLEEYTSMPEAMRTLMPPRGSTPNPTPTVLPVPVVPQVTDDLRAQVLQQETERRTGIAAAFGGFSVAHADLMRTCQDDTGCTPALARERLLTALGGTTEPVNAPTTRHPGHVTNGNIVGDSVRASIYGRLGFEDNQADNHYNYMTLRELARASLQDRGIGVATLRPLDMVAMAFTHTSSDFGNILLDASHRALLAGWEEAEETFHLWTRAGRLSDFKVANRVALGSFSSLREVRPGAEYKNITLNDTGETIKLASYGEIFAIDRQAIINDDLDALSAIPRLMGMAARATIGDLVYALLTENGKMKDGKPLFDASRKNLFTGAGSALSIESMSTAKAAMALQKAKTAEGAKPRTLNIRPAFLLCPVALEDKANQLIRSTSVPTAQVNAGVVNPIKDFARVIADPRLDDASSSTWYLAGRQGGDTIEVAYLDGVDTPYIEQQDGFTIDGISTKVRIDAGVSALDSRGLSRSVGA